MDFNGVIIDDEPVQMQAYKEVLAAEGIDLLEEDYMNSLGMDDRTFVLAAYDRAGREVDDAKVGELVEAKLAKWREAVAADLPLFPGIREVVAKMAREFTLGIVSMSGRREIDLVLERSGLGEFFAAIVSAGDVSRCKPDPEAYRIGFSRLDAVRIARGHLPMTHEECLVIEDSPPGVAAARSADLPALGVANTVSPHELRNAGAGSVAADLRDWIPETIRLVFA